MPPTKQQRKKSFLPNEKPPRITRNASIRIDSLVASALSSSLVEKPKILSDYENSSIQSKPKARLNILDTLPDDSPHRKLFQFFHDDHLNQKCADCKCTLTLPDSLSSTIVDSNNANIVYCSFSVGYCYRKKISTKEYYKPTISETVATTTDTASTIKDGIKLDAHPITITNNIGSRIEYKTSYDLDSSSDDDDYDEEDEIGRYFRSSISKMNTNTQDLNSTVKAKNGKSKIPWSVTIPKKQSVVKKSSTENSRDTKSVITGVTAGTEKNNDTAVSVKLPQNMRLIKFKEAHSVFAPPWENTDGSNHPSSSTTKKENYKVYPKHGVFLCYSCSLAHNTLGSDISTVKNICSTTWKEDEITTMLSSGGNKYANTLYEKYIPPYWKKFNTLHEKSTLADRELYIIAKYKALAFILPNDLLQDHAWHKLLQKRVFTNDANREKDLRRKKTRDRLVDFFCICGPTKNIEKDDNKTSHVKLQTSILSQYPPDNDEQKIPAELHKYVFPNGCRPSAQKKAPMLFTFILTNELGEKMYGSSLQVYDDSMNMEDVLGMVRGAGFEGSLAPVQRSSMTQPPRNTGGAPPQVLHLPKSLVILSHYPMHDIFRKFLLTLYRLSRYKSPIPLERYIANFVSEVPLPPQGKCEIQYSIIPNAVLKDSDETKTDLNTMIISRAMKNKLPLVGFSYRPLFTCLSVSNILIVFGCLLQENRIVLCSKYVSLLGPCSEALVSFLFPFSWQGVHVPVLPYNLLDILDAPVPFLVGLHSKYLHENPPSERPVGVVFVDLDKDIVHLGFEEGTNSLTSYSKCIPTLPDKEIQKLKTKLEEYGNLTYVVPPNNIKGRVTTGTEDEYENKLRELYAYEHVIQDKQAHSNEEKQRNAQRRLMTLARTDRAYPNDEYLVPIDMFTAMNEGVTVQKKSNISKSSATDTTNATTSSTGRNHYSLLDKAGDETINFREDEIREAFLKFFTQLMKNYTRYIQKDENGTEQFYVKEFLNGMEDTWIKKFMTEFTTTQIFSAFSQERVMDSERSEWLFFDEWIVANKKRRVYKKDKKTPFLDDDSDKVTEVYSPPPPSTLGLPSYQVYYQYPIFPTCLNPDLFGKPRERRLFQDNTNSVRPDHHPDLLRQDMVLQSLMFPYSFEEIPKRNLEWAVFVMAYRCIGLKHGSADRKIRIAKLSITMLPEATKFITDARSLQAHYLWCIAKVQSSVLRIKYSKYKDFAIAAAKRVQYNFRRRLYLLNYGKRQKMGLAALYIRAGMIQKIWRGYVCRKQYFYVKGRIILIQSIVRMYLCVLLKRRMVQLITLVHSYHRMSKCVYVYGHIRRLIIKVQASFRGFHRRTRMAKMRKERLLLYRAQIFQLWRRCHTPLIYRSKFWMFINKSGFLYMGFHHEELNRLWNILNIKLSKSFHKNFKKVQQKLNSVKVNDVTTPLQPLFPGEFDPAKRHFFEKAAADLNDERSILFEKLKYELSDDEKIKIFKSFQVDVGEKQKKLRITQYLWEIRKFAKPSAEFVLSMRKVAQPIIHRGFMPCPANERVSVNSQEEDFEDEISAEFFRVKRDALVKKHVAVSHDACVKVAQVMAKYELTNPDIPYSNRKSYAFIYDSYHLAHVSKYKRRGELIAKFLAAEL